MSEAPPRRGRRPRAASWLVLLALSFLGTATAQDAGDWRVLSDFEGAQRLWTAEPGPDPQVVVTDREAHSGRRSLAVTMTWTNQGKSLRHTWGTDVSDLLWSPDSRVRFWIKGSPLAQNPHGGMILIEGGGKQGGGNSYWFLPIQGEIYGDPEWHEYLSPEVSTAQDPAWHPDADGKLDASRICGLMFVAQQEAPPDLNLPFTFYVDDVEASKVTEQPVRYSPATVEDKPDHVTPIWRGFKGREREHPAQVTFEDVTGWRVAQWGDAQATLARSEEEPCYEDLRYQARVTYSSASGSGRFELVPPKPISLAGPFNAACAWVFGNNWSWVPRADTPPVHIWVRLLDAAGQRHRINLGIVNFRFYGLLQRRLWDRPAGDPNHLYWGGPGDGKVHFPATLEAIEVHGGTNPEPRTIYLESVAFYQDDMALPSFRPELIENLPFPTTPDTILPTVSQPTQVRLAREDDAFVFTLRGDERVVYRYTPVTGTLSDLTVQVAGRKPFTPCAGAGPVLLLAGQEREPGSPEVSVRLLEAREADGAVTTRWRAAVADDSAEYTIALRAKGKSLIVDWASRDPRCTALRLGRAEGLTSPKTFRVPYLTIHSQGPSVLLDGDTFFLTLLDWYHTESSGFYTASALEDSAATINGGSYYHPLTDGTRNALGERQFINVSSRFEEVLPSIPNPPSTQGAVTREHLYCHLGGTSPDRFDRWLEMWRTFHRHGIEKVMVSHHEDAWSDGADVGQGPQEYTMCIEAAPEVGDDKLIAYCRAMREMGFYIGLYENFTDYNPLGKSWDERNAARSSHGEMMRVWPPTYAIRPLKALEMALDYPRRVHDKFGCNTAYRDCHTAYPPWGQVDYQAGSPGAGKFSTNFRAWGALLMDGHRAYGGPIFSEGTHQWFSAGLVDGNYAQIGIPNPESYPLLVAFDLRKIHPLEADISMLPSWSWGRGIYHCQAATIAYGHIGFQPAGDVATCGRYYYLMQQLQSRYVMVPVREILYHRDGQLLPVSQALKTGAYTESQVLVRYENGLELAVNCNPERRWTVELAGKRYDLSPDAWAAVQGDDFEEYSTQINGTRIGFVRSPAYLFLDGGGERLQVGAAATDGALALRPLASGGREVIVLAKPTRIEIEAPEGASVRALNGLDEPLGGLAVQREGGRLIFDHLEGAERYVIE